MSERVLGLYHARPRFRQIAGTGPRKNRGATAGRKSSDDLVGVGGHQIGNTVPN